MEYPMCTHTVTVYRSDGTRRVLENCFYRWEQVREPGPEGLRLRTKSLLILPGCHHDIRVGDRVAPGAGPEAAWETLLPATVLGLSQVEYVTPWRDGGSVCHWEAGSR